MIFILSYRYAPYAHYLGIKEWKKNCTCKAIINMLDALSPPRKDSLSKLHAHVTLLRFCRKRRKKHFLLHRCLSFYAYLPPSTWFLRAFAACPWCRPFAGPVSWKSQSATATPPCPKRKLRTKKKLLKCLNNFPLFYVTVNVTTIGTNQN